MQDKRKLIVSSFLAVILLMGLSCTPTGDTSGSPGPDGQTSGDGSTTGSGRQAEAGIVAFDTSDGVTITGNLVQGNGGGSRPAILLVHQLGSDKSSYVEFQTALADAGITSLAIDLRGHGESTADGTLNFRDFNNEQWAMLSEDIIAALDYMNANPEINSNAIGIIGASIGANLAVTVTAGIVSSGGAPVPKGLVLLSPGMNYRGIQPLTLARDIRRIPVLIVSANGDGQSFSGSQALSNATNGELIEFDGSDHGTDLFNAHPGLTMEIIQWLRSRISGTVHDAVEQPTDISEPVSTGEAGS
jgi:dienelactone hydrolase